LRLRAALRRFTLLAGIAALLSGPWLNPRAVDPYHTHLVIGGTPEERAQALAEHTHGPAQPVRKASRVRVVSLNTASPLGPLVLGLGAGGIATSANPSLIPPALGGRLLPHGPVRIRSVDLPAPEPPPRLS
jgi:hypothetical protein